MTKKKKKAKEKKTKTSVKNQNDGERRRKGWEEVEESRVEGQGLWKKAQNPSSPSPPSLLPCNLMQFLLTQPAKAEEKWRRHGEGEEIT